MGGGYYDRDVVSTTTAYSTTADRILTATRTISADCNPKNNTLTCTNRSPVVVAIDVTGSMGNWTKIIYDKLPMFYGQIMLQGYIEDPALSFAAIGDAKSDKAPLQVTPFVQGSAIDTEIAKLWLEGGGGGNDHESYDLAAFYYAHCVNCDNKGFMFITGDEAFYDTVSKEHILQFIGGEGRNIPLKDVIEDLRTKYHVFHIHKPYWDTKLDKRIVSAWEDLIGAENVLLLTDPKAVVDVMLGAIAVVSGARNIDSYLYTDMADRGQTTDRIKTVQKALSRITNKDTATTSTATSAASSSAPAPAPAPASAPAPAKSSAAAATPASTPASLALARKAYKRVLAEKDDDDESESADVRALRNDLQALKLLIASFPADYVCPITQQPFVDPVMTVDGNTYEREAIATWLEKNDTSPATGETLDGKNLIPNLALKRAIAKYREEAQAKLNA